MCRPAFPRSPVGCVCDPVEVPRDDCTCVECRRQEVIRDLHPHPYYCAHGVPADMDCEGCDPPVRVVKKYTPPSHTERGGRGHKGYLALLDELREVHLEKSGGYGTGDDPFANYNAVARHNGRPAFTYAVDRVVEKLERWKSLFAQGRFEELGEEHLDAASLLLCAEALRRST